jgi:DNA-binding NarL/FixJ family response regulator
LSKTTVKYKILLVDDHPVLREGLAGVLGQEKDFIVCGEASDATDAMRKIEMTKPRLVITEIAQVMNGSDFVKALRKKFPDLRILIYSFHPESTHAEGALHAGANGYVMKRESRKTVLSAVRQVLEGKTHISPEVNQKILNKMANLDKEHTQPISEKLSSREMMVFDLIGQGYGTRQIAEKLHLSMKTVETHRQHMKAKLRLDNTYELIQKAIQWVYHENGFRGAA